MIIGIALGRHIIHRNRKTFERLPRKREVKVNATYKL